MRHACVFRKVRRLLFKNDRYQTVESALLSSDFATERLNKLLLTLLEGWQTQFAAFSPTPSFLFFIVSSSSVIGNLLSSNAPADMVGTEAG